VDLVRASLEPRYGLAINDPKPVESAEDVWASAAQMATVGIFVLILVICLYFSRPILLPILAALLIGSTLAPIVKRARKHGIPPWITALFLVLMMMAVAGLAVTVLAGPVGEWIGRAPEIAATNRVVCPITQLVRNPPYEYPVTPSRFSSTVYFVFA
jgi:predicted PurR-regulated permease PerM